MLALLGWQLGHGTALQPWPSTLKFDLITLLNQLHLHYNAMKYDLLSPHSFDCV